MWIKTIDIDGFGVFSGQEIQLDPGLNIFVGDNEAGKSTLLEFVRFVLFGRIKMRDPVIPALAGGVHGGRLILEFEKFGTYTLSRHSKKRKEASFTPSTEGGVEVSLDEALSGLSPHVFKNVFAFSLTELRDLESLQSDELKGLLYGASAGASIVSLPRAHKRFEDKAGEIYKPTGQNPLLNVKLSELADVREQLMTHSQNVEEYDSCVRMVEELERDLSRKRKSLKKLEEAVKRNQDIFSVWQDWERVNTLENELEGVDPRLKQLPGDALSTYERLRGAFENAKASEQTAQDNILAMVREQQEISIDQRIIGQEGEIVALQEAREQILSLQEEQKEVEKEVGKVRKELATKISSFGQGRTEETLKSIGWLDAAASEISELSIESSSAKSRRDSAAWTYESCKVDVGDLQGQIETVQKQLSELPKLETVGGNELVSKVRAGRDKFAADLEMSGELTSLIRDSEKRIFDRIQKVNPAWSPESITSFDVKAWQQLAEQYAVALDEKQKNFKAAETTLQIHDKEFQGFLEEHDRKRRALEEATIPIYNSEVEIQERKVGLRQLKEILVEAELSRLSLKHAKQTMMERIEAAKSEKERKGRSKLQMLRSLGVLTGALVLLAVMGLTVGQIETVFWPALLGSVVSVSVLLVLYRKDGSLESTMGGSVNAILKAEEESKSAFETLQASVDSLENDADKLSKELGLSVSSVSSVELEIDRLDEQRQLVVDLEKLRRASQEMDQKMERLLQARRELELELKTGAAELQACESEWVLKFAKLGVSGAVDSRSIDRLLEEVEKIRTQILSLEDQKIRRMKIDGDVSRFRELSACLECVAQESTSDNQRLLQLVDQAIMEIDGNARNTERRHQLVGQIEVLQEALSELNKRLDTSKIDMISANSNYQRCELSWVSWLRDRGFDEGLSFEEANREIAKFQEAKELIKDREKKIQRLEEISRRLGEFRRRTRVVLESVDSSLEEGADITESIDGLKSSLKLCQDGLSRRSQLANGIKKTQVQEAELRILIAEADAKLKEFFESVGCSSIADLQMLTELSEEVASIRTEVSNKQATLKATLRSVDWNEARKTLEDLSKESLLLEINEQSGRIKELSINIRGEEGSESTGMETKLASARSEVERLSNSKEVERLRSYEQKLVSEVEELAQRWQRFTVALYLLDMAKSEFEKHGQPRVLREAGQYFSLITGKKYGQIRPLIERRQRKLEVLSKKGEWKSVDNLSTGTKEQLYLALRFGFIGYRRENSENVPIVMDDILVNFDPARTKKACEAILKLAKENQVLLFTCHPETAVKFQNLDQSFRMVQIRSGQFVESSPG